MHKEISSQRQGQEMRGRGSNARAGLLVLSKWAQQGGMRHGAASAEGTWKKCMPLVLLPLTRMLCRLVHADMLARAG